MLHNWYIENWEEVEPCQNSSNRTIPMVDTQYKIISKSKDEMLWNLLNNIQKFVIYFHAVGLKVIIYLLSRSYLP